MTSFFKTCRKLFWGIKVCDLRYVGAGIGLVIGIILVATGVW